MKYVMLINISFNAIAFYLDITGSCVGGIRRDITDMVQICWRGKDFR